MGYQPNPFARSLITQKTRIVSISSRTSSTVLSRGHAILTGELQKHGLRVMLFHVPEGKTTDEVLPQGMLYQPEYIILMTAQSRSSAPWRQSIPEPT